MSRQVDYDAVAESYDRRYQNRRYQNRRYAPIEGLVRSFGGQRDVLEVGCGTGHWLALLRDAGAYVAGLDASEEMLEHAREKLGDIELVHGQSRALPWADASFDRVLAVNALHHFEDPPAFFREARRVLRPGGELLTIGLDPHTGSDRWWIYELFPGALERDLARYQPTQRIREWMKARRTGTRGAWPTPAPSEQRADAS